MFQEVEQQVLRENPFKLIGSDWMLITGGRPGPLMIPLVNTTGPSIFKEEYYPTCSLIPGFNTMNATREGVILWELRVATCFVRPMRRDYGCTERMHASP